MVINLLQIDHWNTVDLSAQGTRRYRQIRRLTEGFVFQEMTLRFGRPMQRNDFNLGT